MTENEENIILEHLKRIQSELSGMRENIKELISRVGSLEAGVARLGREDVMTRIVRPRIVRPNFRR